MEQVNIEAEERKAGNIARTALKASLINQIQRTFRRRSGIMLKSSVLARYKEGRLDRLVINSPHYSFKQHYGSTLTGTQKETTRKASSVKSFQRHLEGKAVNVASHDRAGGSVSAMNKNIGYGVHNHLSRALKQTNALEKLATSLGQNRIVLITSQIEF